ncbi:hypothetical protein BDZ91DRAFT_116883 [Kalaharituber pfeilii]|nr:hypothetical protein BDZ91DRAFT_116883 [Kalaharituber pfeilii]
MSSDKPPSLPIPTPPANSTTSSPRTGGTSILNGTASNPGARGGAQNPAKVKTDLNQSANTNSSMQQSHVLPHPTMSSQPHNQYSSSPHNPTPTGQYGYGSEYSSQGYAVGVPLDFPGQHHLSQPQQPSPQTATSSNSLTHYQAHSHAMQPYPTPHPHQPYPFHFPTPNGVSSPSGQPGMPGSMPGQMGILPLPANSGMTPAPSLTSVPPPGSQTSPQSGGPGGSYNGGHHFDTTGQIAPPGMKPRVTATLWEDEGSLCFQVEAKGVCVARREDNHMINGTKLLNVAGMTRGRRDGILKSEKVRHVVKIGPMHLKGVWIPFERALDFANKEKITELLYPLFVHNIGALLYHPTNTSRTNAVMAAANRKFEPPVIRRNPSELVPSSQHPPLHAMSSIGHISPHSTLAPHPQMRPEMSRAITFPTPPSSASDNPYWGQSGMMPNSGTQPLAIDTVINSSRSMPTTPATTPPGNPLGQLQQYPGNNFNEPRSSPLYGSQPQNISQNNVSQQNMNRFGPPLPQPPTHYMNQSRDSNMPPPTTRGQNASRPPSSQNNTDGQVKDENGIVEEQTGLDEDEPEPQEEEADHEADHDYESNVQYSNANARGYFNSVETPHLSPEMTGSPNHQGPGTPNRSVYNTPNVNVPRNMDNATGSNGRTASMPQQQQWVSQSGYSTPPRGAPNNNGVRNPPPGRSIYNSIINDGADRGVEASNGTSNDTYGQHSMGVPVTPQQTPTFGGMNNSNKRIREMDDQEVQGSRPSSRGDEERGGEDLGNKRRKAAPQASTQGAPAVNLGASNFDSRDARNRPRAGVTQRRAR